MVLLVLGGVVAVEPCISATLNRLHGVAQDPAEAAGATGLPEECSVPDRLISSFGWIKDNYLLIASLVVLAFIGANLASWEIDRVREGSDEDGLENALGT